MLMLSVVLAYVQEQRSIRAAEQLKKLVQTSAVVVRDGKEQEIQLTDVVPGDIVVLTAGAIIPADIRVVSAKDFFVNQSSMTGESMPVEKGPAPPRAACTEALDLPNACFQGSTVVSGSASGVAVCTGASTLLGAIARDVVARQGGHEL